MEIVRRVHPMKELCRQARANGRRVGLVPTMGALHEGHLSLIRRTKELADVVVCSVFVAARMFDGLCGGVSFRFGSEDSVNKWCYCSWLLVASR